MRNRRGRRGWVYRELAEVGREVALSGREGGIAFYGEANYWFISPLISPNSAANERKTNSQVTLHGSNSLRPPSAAVPSFRSFFAVHRLTISRGAHELHNRLSDDVTVFATVRGHECSAIKRTVRSPRRSPTNSKAAKTGTGSKYSVFLRI